MDIRWIDDDYAVTGQITPEDVNAIADMGFKAIVRHRPDGENASQPDFALVQAKAAELGIEIRQIAVGPTGLTADKVHAMVDALDEMPRPMLGYCRSGARSTAIYQHTHHIRG